MNVALSLRERKAAAPLRTLFPPWQLFALLSRSEKGYDDPTWLNISLACVS
jgi:hypothetical protein